MNSGINLAAAVNWTQFGQVVDPIFTNVVDPLLVLAFAVALTVFVYGVVQLMTHPTDAEAHEKGRSAMIYGVIGIFIMVAAWGILNIVANTVKQF